MISFQKTLFDNTFGAMIMVQEQTEKVADAFLVQLPWDAEDGKKTMNDVVRTYKEARDNFKKAVDEGFLKMEEIFVPK